MLRSWNVLRSCNAFRQEWVGINLLFFFSETTSFDVMTKTFPECHCAWSISAAALSLRGSSAHLNFPKLASSLPRPHDLSDKCIQAAANEAAKRFSLEVTSQRQFFMLDATASSSIADSANPHSHCKLQAIAVPNSLTRIPMLTTCNAEPEHPEEYFSSKRTKLPLPTTPPNPSNYRENSVRALFLSPRFERQEDVLLPMNAVSSHSTMAWQDLGTRIAILS